jgi:hypothetical protein
VLEKFQEHVGNIILFAGMIVVVATVAVGSIKVFCWIWGI